MYALIFSTTFVWNISHYNKNGDIIKKKYFGLHVKYRLLLLDFNGTWKFSRYFRKILRYQITWKNRPLEAELFREDGQTDRHGRANSRFMQFCEHA